METIEELQKWRVNLNISRDSIGKILGGLSRYIIYSYEKKITKIPPELLKKYADFIAKCKAGEIDITPYLRPPSNNFIPAEKVCTKKQRRELRKIRRELNLSLREVGELLGGIDGSTLSKRENGKLKMKLSDYEALMRIYKQERRFIQSIPDRRV